jgi:hypothetical protein
MTLISIFTLFLRPRPVWEFWAAHACTHRARRALVSNMTASTAVPSSRTLKVCEIRSHSLYSAMTPWSSGKRARSSPLNKRRRASLRVSVLRPDDVRALWVWLPPWSNLSLQRIMPSYETWANLRDLRSIVTHLRSSNVFEHLPAHLLYLAVGVQLHVPFGARVLGHLL